MIEFCGLEWDDACLRPEQNQRVVKTASVWQARQPIYGTSVSRWRRYEPWLGPSIVYCPQLTPKETSRFRKSALCEDVIPDKRSDFASKTPRTRAPNLGKRSGTGMPAGGVVDLRKLRAEPRFRIAEPLSFRLEFGRVN